jgi:CHAD domain-containing protein
MRGDDALADAGVALLGKRLKKAKRKVRAAAKGDAGGVHDLRVAIRKIRAASSVLGDTVTDRAALRKTNEELKTLFSALGDVRDHDVMVERVTKMAKRRGVEGKRLERLLRELRVDGRRLTKKLRAAMRRDAPENLFDRVARAALRAVADARPDDDDHRVLVRHYAASVLLRRYETVLAYEVVLPAPMDLLHRLRVAIKKLRYAIDFFEDALGSGAAAIDRSLQKAQDQLGELHDHHVALARIARVERKRGPKGAIVEVRIADDEDAKRLLAAFGRTWTNLSRGPIATALLKAIGTLLGPGGARVSTLALRRAELGAPR